VVPLTARDTVIGATPAKRATSMTVGFAKLFRTFTPIGIIVPASNSCRLDSFPHAVLLLRRRLKWPNKTVPLLKLKTLVWVRGVLRGTYSTAFNNQVRGSPAVIISTPSLECTNYRVALWRAIEPQELLLTRARDWKVEGLGPVQASVRHDRAQQRCNAKYTSVRNMTAD